MSAPEERVLFWSKLWVELTVGAVAVIATFSLFSAMRLGGWVALTGGLLWVVFRARSSGIHFSSAETKENRLFRALAGLCFVSLCVRPHSFLDSYSYRIPQMLLWLQEGHPWFVPNVDFRINQMPHIWPFLSTVFFLPFGERGLAVPNLISFVLLFKILSDFARQAGIPAEKAKWILLIFMTSPVMVMQAASNDNTLTCVAFLMISAYFALLQKPSTANVSYSALALSLCCGIKPQYVTLAPLWLIWFFFGRSAPMRLFRWPALLWLIPLAVLCSPVPTLTVNYFLHESITRPAVSDSTTVQPAAPEAVLDEAEDAEEDVSGTSAGMRLIHSYVSLGNQLVALPVNPLAGKLTAWMRRSAERLPWLRWLDWHQQRIYPLLIPEHTSLGFFATIALIAGIVFSEKWKRKKYLWLASGSILCMMLAILFTTPGSLGRSFVGFVLLILPLAFSGLEKINTGIIRLWGVCCLLVGMIIIIINPACPLWPVKTIAQSIPCSSVRQQLLDYARFSQRHLSARALVQEIPETEPVIGAVIDHGRPLVELWKPFCLRRKVRFYSPAVTPEQLEKDEVSFLIIKTPDLISQGGTLSSEFLHRIGGHVVREEEYTSYMQLGARPWFLVSILP